MPERLLPVAFAVLVVTATAASAAAVPSLDDDVTRLDGDPRTTGTGSVLLRDPSVGQTAPGRGPGNGGGKGPGKSNGKDGGSGKAKGKDDGGGGKNGGGNANGKDGGKSKGGNGKASGKDNGNGGKSKGGNGKANGKAGGKSKGGNGKDNGKSKGGNGKANGKDGDDDGGASGPPGVGMSNGNETKTGGPKNETNRTVRGRSGYPAPPLDRSALAFRQAAIDRLDGDTALVAGLEAALEHHVDPNRVDSGAFFYTDKHVAATSRAHSPNVTGYVVAADAVLAHTAVDDAERVATELRQRNHSYDESAVSEQLEKARRALAKGDDLRGQSMGAPTHYRRAWAHSQRAIDLMGEAVEPQVSIDTRRDLPHNGTLSHPVNGTVFDVRGYELNATLRVNDTDERELPLAVDTAPGSVARFNASVELLRQWPGRENRTYEITVEARDPGIDYAVTASEGFEEVHDPQNATDTLGLDADGLPDTYERDVTGTDPLDADSDSDRTASEEAGNGLIDGAEDLDGESVSNYREFLEGLDPLDPDTDDDELTDAFELRYPGIDPHVPDTDGDGTGDAAEDLDGEGLSNLREQNHSTSPVLNDTDRDTLDDRAEIDEYGTDPNSPDTDGDGLSDAAELFELGTNPLSADTDDDGTPDGEETFTTSTANVELGASVAVTGEGNVAEAVRIENGSRTVFDAPGPNEARASPFVEFESGREFDSATITIEYEESRVPDGDESDLAVFRFNESIGTFEPLESTVDPANDTVSAETSRFSTFVVFSESTWESFFDEPLPPEYSERISEFDEANVTCEGSGVCSVDGETVTVGQPPTVSTSGLGVTIQLHESPEYGDVGDDDDGSDVDDGDGELDDDEFDDIVSGCEIMGENICDDDGGDGGSGGGGGSTPPPDADGDGDGVEDDEDDCPDVAGDPDTEGCPDSDDDGTRDSQDDCPNDPEATAKPCYIETAQVATFDLPAGAEEIDMRVRFRVDVPDGDSYAEVRIEGESGTETVYSEHSVGGTGFGYETRTTDVSRFAGETVTVEIEKAGDAYATVDNADVILDSDGDGLTDNEELKPTRIGLTPMRSAWITTDPHSADTDGDGLSDSYEMGAESISYRYGSYYDVNSNPREPDTDADGLDDYEEPRMWDSDPLDEDTDGDDFSDFTDPRIHVDDQPPTVRDIASTNFNKYVEVTARDQSQITIEPNPQYDPARGSPYWDPNMASVEHVYGDRYRVEFESHGLLQTPPERYWLNVTDDHGNSRVVLVEVEESGGAQVAATGVVVGLAAETPVPDITYPERALIGAGILLVAGTGTVAYNEIVPADGTESINEPLTQTEEVYRPDLTGAEIGVEITLPVGAVATAYDARTGKRAYRGHGWAYISATSTVDKAEIEEVLRNPDRVIRRDGEIRAIIGRVGNEEIVLAIIGGFLLAATSDATAYDDCTEQVIDVQHSEEHYTRDTDPEKPFEDRSTAKKAFDDVVKVFKDSKGNLWYVIAVGDYYTVALVKKASESMLVYAERYLRTFLTDRFNERTLFKTLKDAEDAIDDQSTGPLTEIDC